MPRKAKPARLWERKRKDRPTTWIILDRGQQFSTGASSREDAEKCLQEHLARKARPSGPTAPDEFLIGHALQIYAEEHAQTLEDPARAAYAIEALDPFWGHLPVSAINGPTCRRYAAQRNRAPDTIRRELGVLRKALNHCGAEGYLVQVPIVTLPDKPDVTERWLSRDQFATLLKACRHLRIDGRQQMQRFLIASVYTGTRKSATLALSIDQPQTHGGWIDTERGILRRKGTQERSTAKRRTPARCPQRLLAHVRRWKRLGSRYVCEDYKGRRVANNRKAWDQLVEIACKISDDMPPVEHLTPHILKHTAITWAIQNGARIEDAASYFATSIETIQRVYWHHSPYAQESAVSALDNPVKGAFHWR